MAKAKRSQRTMHEDRGSAREREGKRVAALTCSSQLVVMRRLVTAVALTSKAPQLHSLHSLPHTLSFSLPSTWHMHAHAHEAGAAATTTTMGRRHRKLTRIFLNLFLAPSCFLLLHLPPSAPFAFIFCVHIHHAWQATYAPCSPLAPLALCPRPLLLHSCACHAPLLRCAVVNVVVVVVAASSFLPAAQLYLASFMLLLLPSPSSSSLPSSLLLPLL